MNGGSDESSGTQFIVFVKTIEVAKQLKELLASERAYKCEHLIGTRGDYCKCITFGDVFFLAPLAVVSIRQIMYNAKCGSIYI